MNKKTLVFVGILALALPAAFAQAPMTGLWKCTLAMEGQPGQDGQLDLQQSGKDVTGTGSNAAGSAPIKGTFADSKFALVVQTGDADWNLDGKLDAGKLVGTFAIPSAGVKGSMTCSKGGDTKSETKADAKPAGGSLKGLWKCMGKVPGQPDGEFQLDLDVKGEDVSGTGSNAAGSAPLTGKFKDGKFTLKIDAGDIVYEFEGKLDGGKITGNFGVPAAGVKGTFEGSKS